ncbi:MAG: MBL fold metallo-hydrolase [Candidatus Heimdallarchaeota archaeon]|nr:MAG: MBL fold metallo-hydrolase [Candidatus Heimdallarchaeota archaeon]
MKIQKLDIQIIVDNNAGPGGTLGESGFSALAEVTYTDSTSMKLLFDTGPSPVAFLNNVKKLKIDLTLIDAIILSHGHWDHVGGLKEAIALSKKRVPVICHPEALLPKVLIEKGKVSDIGIQGYITTNDLKNKTNLITKTTSHKLSESVLTTGKVPRQNDFELLSGRLKKITTVKNGTNVPDKIEDDLSLIFHLVDDTIVILSGCCHSGIVNTTALATELTCSSKVVGIIGGLHLHDASDERLSKTVQALKKYPIKKMAPCHCSGLRGKFALSAPFGKQFTEVGVTTKLQFEAYS